LAYSFSVTITLIALITGTYTINLKTWITLITQVTLAVLIGQITIKTPQNITDKSHNPSSSNPQKHIITTDHTITLEVKAENWCPTKIITTKTLITWNPLMKIKNHKLP
jgi:hypothetical protein